MRAPLTARARLWRIVSTVFFTFAAYLTIGFSLSVLPGFVHHGLGFGTVLAGLAISTQYLATLLSRPHVGRMTDNLGPKRTVLIGLGMGAISALLLSAGAWLASAPGLSLGVILLARLALGCAESCVGTGAIAWGMAQVGHEHTARVISWNGVATYGALAAGAPLGVALAAHGHLLSVGLVSLALMLIALPLAWFKAASPVTHGERYPFMTVARRVVPYGAGLAMGSIGFGCIATFITLFYGAHGWAGAALSLTVFGVVFVGTRFVFGWTIPRAGGYRVAAVSLVLEAVGLALVWHAASPAATLVGVGLAGFGFSLVFPALGVEAVSQVPAHSRGSALGVYSVFMDVALALTGPLGGWLASDGRGFAPVYAASGVIALAAVVLTLWLRRRSRHGADPVYA
ncbi:MFS transporter [Oleiagrimonas sp. C23AA]|nr:MFS transporter [Oleiagrimonas sp. C23AA]